MKGFFSRLFKRPSIGAEFGNRASSHRFIFFADAIGATFQISFLLPLQEEIRSGQIYLKVYTQADVKGLAGAGRTKELFEEIERIDPSMIVFSRYGGECYREIVESGRARAKKIIFHLDDNLYALPPDLGAVYHQRHLAPPVVACREYLAKSADLVYCSTKPLEELMRAKFSISNTFSGIYSAFPGPVLASQYNQSQILGYMGTKSHQRDLDLALPGVYDFLTKNPEWKFELFGDFAEMEFPAHLRTRIEIIPVERDYAEFRTVLNSRRWQVGLLPLLPDEFNQVKAPTKFIEYTAAGAVSLASPFGPYARIAGSNAAIAMPDWGGINDALLNPEGLKSTFQSARAYCESNFASNQMSQQVRHLLLLN